MMEIKKCHVCGSEDIISDVAYRTGSLSASSVINLYYEERVSGNFEKLIHNLTRTYGDTSNSVLKTQTTKAALCRKCGTVRLYVSETDLDWIEGSRQSQVP